VFIVDNQGKLQSQFDTSSFSPEPQGIAYDSAADRYVIADSTDAELFFVSTTGVLLSQCDTSGPGINQPIGIAFNSATGFYAITDIATDEVFIVNSACTIQAQFDTLVHGAADPRGITYRPDTDQYEVIDATGNEFYIFDASAGGLGNLVAQFDISASSIDNSIGLAFNPDDRVTAISDHGWDQVFPVDHRGTLVSTFDIATLGIFDPTDLALNTSTGNLLITDDVSDFINKVTTAGVSAGFCNAALIGANVAQGIAYLAATDQFAIADIINDEIYLISPACALASTFDTSNIDSDNPTGLGVDLLFGDLTLTDSGDDAIRYLDPLGTLKGQCSTSVFAFAAGNGGGPIVGIFEPQDMAHISAASNYAVIDSSNLEVAVFNTLCLPVLHFDVGGLPAPVPTGIAVDNAAKRIFVVDQSADEVYELDLPRVFEATTLSGSFLSAGVATVNIKETGDGFFSGRVDLAGGGSSNIAGFFDAAALTMDIVSSPGGVAFAANVAADLNSFSAAGFPPFIRQ
jgi:DNA-binding beta-propeller fold protein YncE